MKHLCRSRKNRIGCGVCGGVAEYFDIDPVLVRLGFLVLSAVAGSGLLLYILGAIIVPEQEQVQTDDAVEEPWQQQRYDRR